MSRRLACLGLGVALLGCPAPVLQSDGGGPQGGGSAGGEGPTGGQGGQGGGPGDCGTLDDTCNRGVLQGNMCVKVPLAYGTPCDDGLSCTFDEFCELGACTGGVPPACLPPDTCHVVTCDGASGQCEVVPATDASACDDHNPCTTVDGCVAGVCVGGGPEPDCSSWNAECRVGVCDPAIGCTFENAPGPCTSDGVECTDDHCEGGSCVNAVAPGNACDDADPCTVTSFCTDDPGVCQAGDPAPDGTTCERSFCVLDEACVAGTCAGSTERQDCPAPSDACLVAGCGSLGGFSSGFCFGDAYPMLGLGCDSACRAGGSCTGGGCNGGAPAFEGAACDDHDACTTGESCVTGECAGVPISACVSGDGCCPAGCDASADADCAARVYLASGNGGPGFYALDLDTMAWSTLPDAPVPSVHRLASDGRAVFSMGVDRKIYRYDPATEAWDFYRDGPGTNLAPAPVGVDFTDFFAWTPVGLVVGDLWMSSQVLFRESGDAWGAVSLYPSSDYALTGTFDSANQQLVLRGSHSGVFQVDLRTGNVTPFFSLAGGAYRGGSYLDGWFYRVDGYNGSPAEIVVLDLASNVVGSTGLTVDDVAPDTDVDPATGDIYFAPSQPTGTFQVLHTSDLTLDPLPPPPAFPDLPVIVVARAPSE